jgi:hypothetical protein
MSNKMKITKYRLKRLYFIDGIGDRRILGYRIQKKKKKKKKTYLVFLTTLNGGSFIDIFGLMQLI